MSQAVALLDPDNEATVVLMNGVTVDTLINVIVGTGVDVESGVGVVGEASAVSVSAADVEIPSRDTSFEGVAVPALHAPRTNVRSRESRMGFRVFMNLQSLKP